MKKVLLSAMIILNVVIAHGQFTNLYSFSNTPDGLYPNCDLVFDGNYFYGMTSEGGVSSSGIIFKIKPDGTAYSKLLDFAGISNGKTPYGSLIFDGTFLYGMTNDGGINNFGTIFKIKCDGTGYSKLLDFSGASNGQNPSGSLVFDGTFLYGMTRGGGINNFGTIFKIKSDGTGYSKLFDFAGTSNGRNPCGSLIFDGTFLYGMAELGGINNFGTIFKIKPDGTGYSKLFDFSGTSNGKNPCGSLIFDGTFLYGMALHGGTTDGGVAFKIKSDGTGYIKLIDFTGTNGQFPQGSFISDGTFLYGMTIEGGWYVSGIIFKINPDGTGYSILHAFDGLSGGSYPGGSLISDGTFLYGMTSSGGLNNSGLIFKYHPLGMGVDEYDEENNISIYPNPTTGIFNLKMNEFENLKMKEVKIYNVLSECVYQLNASQINSSSTLQIDLTDQATGIYFIKVMSEDKVVSTKKIVKE